MLSSLDRGRSLILFLEAIMRSNALLLLMAAVPTILAANSVSIGFSTDPVDFTASTSSTGSIKIGNCSTDCELDGNDIASIPMLAWKLKSDSTLAYTYSGTPDVYNLSGSTTDFVLTDKQGDSIPG